MSRLGWLCAAAVLAALASGAAAREYVVDVQHPQAADENPATPDRPLKTVGKAALLAKPGDTVLVRPGVYREAVRLRQSGTAEADHVCRRLAGRGPHHRRGHRHRLAEGLWRRADLPRPVAAHVYHQPCERQTQQGN